MTDSQTVFPSASSSVPPWVDRASEPERPVEVGATTEGYGRLGDAARWVVDRRDRTSEAVCGTMPAKLFREMVDGQR